VADTLTDAELPGYCELHCRTDCALFHSSHLNRILELAGHPEGYAKIVPEGFHTVRAHSMDPIVKLARERMLNPGDAK
jgi:hypothetical protein